MLPLAKDFRLGGFLAYLATCLLCLAFGGIAYFYRLFPFVAFFGLHPLVNALQKRYTVRKWLAWPLKAVWFDGMLCATVALLFAFNVDIALPFGWSAAWIYPIVVALGTLVFLLYDWVMFRFQRFADYYVRKIERGRGGKVPPQPGPQGMRSDADDVFGCDPLEGPAAEDGGNGGADAQPSASEENSKGGNGGTDTGEDGLDG